MTGRGSGGFLDRIAGFSEFTGGEVGSGCCGNPQGMALGKCPSFFGGVCNRLRGSGDGFREDAENNPQDTGAPSQTLQRPKAS